jgi:hypothetical protein
MGAVSSNLQQKAYPAHTELIDELRVAKRKRTAVEAERDQHPKGSVEYKEWTPEVISYTNEVASLRYQLATTPDPWWVHFVFMPSMVFTGLLYLVPRLAVYRHHHGRHLSTPQQQRYVKVYNGPMSAYLAKKPDTLKLFSPGLFRKDLGLMVYFISGIVWYSCPMWTNIDPDTDFAEEFVVYPMHTRVINKRSKRLYHEPCELCGVTQEVGTVPRGSKDRGEKNLL